VQDRSISHPEAWGNWRVAGVGAYCWHILEDRLEWSSELEVIYGCTSPPTAEHGFTALVHPDDRVRVEAETSSYLEHGSTYAHEFRIIRPDGEIRVVHDRGVIDRAADETAVAMRGVNVDVTPQRRPHGRSDAPEDLARFRRLVDNIDQLAWMTDGTGFIYWYNQRWYDYTGSTPEAMRGWGWTAVHHPDHVDRAVASFSAALESGTPWEDTFPLRRHDGVYRWFLSRAQPMRDGAGQITHWFGTNTDVTDRRYAEARLARSEERFRRMADSMPQLVWSADADGRAIYYNRQVANYAVIPKIGDGSFDWSHLIHPEDLALTGERWTEAVASGEEFSCEHRLMLADGRARWHLSRAVPAPADAEGGTVWFGTSTDIDELKRLQEHRLLLSQELDHRMKNALTLVQSIANQTFRAMGGDMEAVRAFNARLRALAQANDMLVQGDWSEADLGEICRRTIAPLGIEDRVEMEGGLLAVPPRMGFLLSLGLHELATNALKHGSLTVPEGRVMLTWAGSRGDGGRFHVTWAERDGPAVAEPRAEGFGSRLLKSALAAEIEGEVDIAFDKSGLTCRMVGQTG
jgi:PAS domain S-box-containing protein